MKNNKPKKLIAFCLAVLMIPALTPTTSFAEQTVENTSTGTITWENPFNDPGSKVLEIDEDVENGAWPRYDGPTPVRLHSSRTFFFSGWSPDVHAVNGN